jgi:quercetin dioxygenase-like cupin family protein
VRTIRRVVTGHDGQGRSQVLLDEERPLQPAMRPGVSSALMWWTASSPADNDGDADAGQEGVATMVDGGTVFRVVRYEPGVAPRPHRTSSIDYALVISGEIDLELEEGVVQLKAGDVLVQRGTWHNWIVRGEEAAVVAFVLIAAEPVKVGRRTLGAAG